MQEIRRRQSKLIAHVGDGGMKKPHPGNVAVLVHENLEARLDPLLLGLATDPFRNVAQETL